MLKFLLAGLGVLVVSLLSSDPILKALEPAQDRLPTATIDCTAASVRCAELVIAGDSAARLLAGQPSPFRGFADPSIRRDPVTGRLWMAYSWPNVHVAGAGRLSRSRTITPGVDIHLASSDDAGRTWRFQGSLWSSERDSDRGGNSEAGYTDHEVANLLPRRTREGVVWYGVRLDYFLPENGGFSRRPPSSFRVVVMQAGSPDALRSAPGQVLGSAVTAAGWGVDVNLSLLSPQVRDCGLWNEPALYVRGDNLYLALRCLRFDGKRPRVADSDIVVFATQPTGNVGRWRWRYVGRLAGGAEARELGGTGVTQIDLAHSVDGQLLLIATPDDWSDRLQDFVHHGCTILEVESIDPPKLARDDSGRLKVRAVVTASDQKPLGPGACAYDPASTTGVLLVRRDKERGSMTASIHRTALKP
jgi:hypothetical protein